MQNYYSKNTVLKLRARVHFAEENFASTLTDNEKLGIELTEVKAQAARYSDQLDKERSKTYELTRKIEILEGKREQRDTCMAQVKRNATERAHTELHKIKAVEKSPEVLQRAIGNAQGILAAALDANNGYAPSIDLYPHETMKAGLYAGAAVNKDWNGG